MKPKTKLIAILSFLCLTIMLFAFQQGKKTFSPKLLIGKWKYSLSEANPFNIPDLEFKADSTANLTQSGTPYKYKYYLKNDLIYLKDSKGATKNLHLVKLAGDSLSWDATIFSTVRFDYFRVK